MLALACVVFGFQIGHGYLGVSGWILGRGKMLGSVDFEFDNISLCFSSPHPFTVMRQHCVECIALIRTYESLICI